MNKSHTEIVFGKPLLSLTYDDISKFFKEEQEENSILEFKSGESQLEAIFREVCAFLNTDGGILIIGAPKEIIKGSKKICVGDLTTSPFSNKDWLSQKIASNIQPSPSGINIIELSHKDIKVFICEIRQSLNPPHQCNDGKYYIRLESEAKFAPHGLVLALFNKRKTPDVYFSLKIGYDDLGMDMEKSEAVIEIRNKSEIPTDTIHYNIDVYNVEEIGLLSFSFISSPYEKHGYVGKIDIPLIKFISAPLRFSYKPLSKKYLISIYAWSKEVPLRYKYWVVTSGTTNIEFEGDQNSEKSITDAIEEVLY